MLWIELLRPVDLASLVHDVGWWLSGKVSTMHSAVAGSISSGEITVYIADET